MRRVFKHLHLESFKLSLEWNLIEIKNVWKKEEVAEERENVASWGPGCENFKFIY